MNSQLNVLYFNSPLNLVLAYFLYRNVLNFPRRTLPQSNYVVA